MLLILAIRLQLFLVRSLVLGADQGVRRSVSFGREIQVALVLPNLLFEVATAILPHAEPVHRLARVFQKSPQFRAVRALQEIAASRRKSVGSRGACEVRRSNCSRHTATQRDNPEEGIFLTVTDLGGWSRYQACGDQ